jgi:hypothetical protein
MKYISKYYLKMMTVSVMAVAFLLSVAPQNACAQEPESDGNVSSTEEPSTVVLYIYRPLRLLAKVVGIGCLVYHETEQICNLKSGQKTTVQINNAGQEIQLTVANPRFPQTTKNLYIKVERDEYYICCGYTRDGLMLRLKDETEGRKKFNSIKKEM